MKLWMVKFYITEIKTINKPTYRPSIFGRLKMELKTETKLEEREIKATIVASEEEADILVKGFTDNIALTRAEKIELEG